MCGSRGGSHIAFFGAVLVCEKVFYVSGCVSAVCENL